MNSNGICPICGYDKCEPDKSVNIEKEIEIVKEKKKSDKIVNNIVKATNAVFGIPIILDIAIIIYFIIRFIIKFKFNLFDILGTACFIFTFRYFATYIITDVILKIWSYFENKK